jgi:hypothetical protein
LKRAGNDYYNCLFILVWFYAVCSHQTTVGRRVGNREMAYRGIFGEITITGKIPGRGTKNTCGVIFLRIETQTFCPIADIKNVP